MTTARSAAVALIGLFFALVLPAFGGGFESDDGGCAGGVLATWQGHELSHNLSAYTAGAKPPHRWPIIGGASWTDDHKGWKNTAKAGHIFNLISIALTAGDESFEIQCRAYGNWIAINFYGLHVSSDNFGDFWPYKNRQAAGMAMSLASSLMVGIGERFSDDIEWLRR